MCVCVGVFWWCEGVTELVETQGSGEKKRERGKEGDGRMTAGVCKRGRDSEVE